MKWITKINGREFSLETLGTKSIRYFNGNDCKTYNNMSKAYEDYRYDINEYVYNLEVEVE